MKTFSFLFGFVVLSYNLVVSQGGTPHFKDWNLKAIATGNASGHIADFTLTNPSSSSATSPSGPFMIVNDFRNTFEAVGAEAKIFSIPVVVPDTPSPAIDHFWDNYTTAEAKKI